MYAVSQSYIEAMHRPVQRHKLRGTIGDVPFTESDILSGSFIISGQCSDTSNVQIGQVYITELKMTVINKELLSRYTLKDSVITPYYGLRLASSEFEYIPLGVFTINQASWGVSGVEITAYDNMAKFDRTFTTGALAGTPYELAKLACDNCGVQFGMRRNDFGSFANGEEILTLYMDNDIQSWRDVLAWVSQAIAANALIDREGKLYFRSYGEEVTDEIGHSRRLSGASFGDYETRYTGLSCVNIEAQTTSYYGAEQDDGLTYNLGSNPFLQPINDANADALRRNVLTALGKIRYVPFKTDIIGNPAYDLMDCIRFTDGIADGEKISCITKYTFRFNDKYTMQGVGQNPELETANSKSDKRISGLMATIESITSSINNLVYDYNTGPVYVRQYEKMLGIISYYISQKADVEGHITVYYHASESTHLILRIYDTTVEELYSPLEYDLPEGYGTISVPHSYLHRKTGIHSVYLTAQCTLGMISIDPRGVYFTINAGNFAKAVDDIAMDIRDISMRQLQESNGPDQIWTAGIEEDELLFSSRTYREDYYGNLVWEGMYSPGKAKDAALEFDGDWVLRSKEEKFTIQTEDQPWYFWIDMDDNLITQHGNDETTRLILDEGISSVNACRGYSSQYYAEQDQGLVVVYIKSGDVWYQQYVYDVNLGKKVWSDPVLLREGNWMYAHVHRLNDYRLSFQLTSETQNLWLITDRMYVAQAVPTEDIRINDRRNAQFLYCPPDTDLSINFVSELSEDKLTITISADRELIVFNGKIDRLLSYSGGISRQDIESVQLAVNDGSSVITILLKNEPSQTLSFVTMNPDSTNDLQYRIGDMGTVVCPNQRITVDTTVYHRIRDDEEVLFSSVSALLIYRPIEDIRAAMKEEVVIANSELSFRYSPIEYLDANYEEDVSFTNSAFVLNYQQTGESPI